MPYSTRKICLHLSAAVAATLYFANAHAADETGKWYINPYYGWTQLDDSRQINANLQPDGMHDGDHFGIGFGKHITEMWSVELNGLWGDFDSNTPIKLKQNAYSLDGLMVFNRAGAVSPYLTMGAGYIENKFSDDPTYGEFIQGGLGAMFDLGENSAHTFVFQIRPELKYRYDWANGKHGPPNSGDWIANLGFAFNFGPSNAPPPPVTQYTPPPPAAAPPPPPPPVDSDGDGVPDMADRCPGTPLGTVVDEKGCPREPVVLRGVGFANASATLTPASLPILDGVAADLRIHPLVRVELQGHTDSVGKDEYNLDLSQRRAESVRNYLISQGVSGDRLVAKGYGETVPIADNATAQGRAQNRRVVMKVLENPNNAEIQGEAPPH